MSVYVPSFSGFHPRLQEEYEHWNFPQAIQAVSQWWCDIGRLGCNMAASYSQTDSSMSLQVWLPPSLLWYATLSAHRVTDILPTINPIINYYEWLLWLIRMILLCCAFIHWIFLWNMCTCFKHSYDLCCMLLCALKYHKIHSFVAELHVQVEHVEACRCTQPKSWGCISVLLTSEHAAHTQAPPLRTTWGWWLTINQSLLLLPPQACSRHDWEH